VEAYKIYHDKDFDYMTRRMGKQANERFVPKSVMPRSRTTGKASSGRSNSSR